jgi:hypothetical protein
VWETRHYRTPWSRTAVAHVPGDEPPAISDDAYEYIRGCLRNCAVTSRVSRREMLLMVYTLTNSGRDEAVRAALDADPVGREIYALTEWMRQYAAAPLHRLGFTPRRSR